MIRDYDPARVADEKATQQWMEKLREALRSGEERRIEFALTVVARLTGKAPAELREEAEQEIVRQQQLVSEAAEASERFGDDECERFVAELRQRKERR